ncbi:MAG TPA: right-handed parallel beta-helix repeat-containing protein, partial [Saprospiraceae bacterium]|nr:right-handed parallel beta-helix repeat-containing protein [Saprospiraceae bacterium]
MKKLSTFLAVIFMLSISHSIFAQADTVFIASNPLPGTLRDAIIGDTLADGSRTNPDRVYQLERNGVYFLSGMFVAGFDLKIFAEAPDATHRPPIIAPAQAAGIDHDFICQGDVSFRNLYISNISAGGSRNFGGILCFGDNHTYELDSCILEGNQWNGFVIFGPTKKITMTNCVVRNSVNSGSPWNGRGLSTRDQPVEEVVIENNTFYNLNSFVFRGEWNEIKKMTFNHNTMVNTIKWPLQWHYATDATFNYNIFYNTHCFGESASERAGQDKDGQPFGIFNLFELEQHTFIDSLGYVEGERKVTVSNNDYFFSSEITDFWASIDSVEAEPWMNERTQGMFDDDANYTALNEIDTKNMDPEFIEVGNTAAWSTIDSMVLFMRGLRDTNVVKPLYWGFEPDPSNPPFNMEWPLPENLAYTNATLMTAAPGGCPIGDLNWFPAQKEG